MGISLVSLAPSSDVGLWRHWGVEVQGSYQHGCSRSEDQQVQASVSPSTIGLFHVPDKKVRSRACEFGFHARAKGLLVLKAFSGQR